VVVHVYSLVSRHHVLAATPLPRSSPCCRPLPGSTGARRGTSGRTTRCSASASTATAPGAAAAPDGFEGHPLRKDFGRPPGRGGGGRAEEPGERACRRAGRAADAAPGPPHVPDGWGNVTAADQPLDGLPARSRGVIALLEENCTVCMLCARECPDWCIYRVASEPVPGAEYGGAGIPPRAPAGRGRRCVRKRPRPLRDRLLAVHVLRDLRRPARTTRCSGRPVLLRRDTTSRPSPTSRTGCANGCGPCRRRPRTTRGSGRRQD
jgi:hypothetical protein